MRGLSYVLLCGMVVAAMAIQEPGDFSSDNSIDFVPFFYNRAHMPPTAMGPQSVGAIFTRGYIVKQANGTAISGRHLYTWVYAEINQWDRNQWAPSLHVGIC